MGSLPGDYLSKQNLPDQQRILAKILIVHLQDDPDCLMGMAYDDGISMVYPKDPFSISHASGVPGICLPLKGIYDVDRVNQDKVGVTGA